MAGHQSNPLRRRLARGEVAVIANGFNSSEMCDFLATSIVVPHVVTPDQAEHAARACRYPPEGCRGVAGNRRRYGASDYFPRANEEVQCIALIEDAAALDNLDALLRVEGVDVFQVAPSDLAASMGHIGEPSCPTVQQAIEDAIEMIVAFEAGPSALDDHPPPLR